jgi:hypothetical protein
LLHQGRICTLGEITDKSGYPQTQNIVQTQMANSTHMGMVFIMKFNTEDVLKHILINISVERRAEAII